MELICFIAPKSRDFKDLKLKLQRRRVVARFRGTATSLSFVKLELKAWQSAKEI
jgi:hypothetical protein